MTDTTLTLADGTLINTRTGRPVRAHNGVPSGYDEVPTHSEAVQQLVRVRKRLADLPDVPQKMNVIGVVAAYYMFGLSDMEIAIALDCTEGQVAHIKMTDAFGKLTDAMTENIVESQQDDVRTFLANNTKRAAQSVVDMMDDEDSKVAIVAAKDILDRGGHRPADVVEHRHRVEGGLTIEYVKRGGDDDKMPALDLDPTQYTEGDDNGDGT